MWTRPMFISKKKLVLIGLIQISVFLYLLFQSYFLYLIYKGHEWWAEATAAEIGNDNSPLTRDEVAANAADMLTFSGYGQYGLAYANGAAALLLITSIVLLLYPLFNSGSLVENDT